MHFNKLAFLSTLPLAFGVPTTQCKISTVKSTDIINGNVPVDASVLPLSLTRALQKPNITAWEHWYFDGASNSGDKGITIVFYRDATLLTEGLKPLRISINAARSDGTKFSTTIFAEHSTIETCADGTTRGRWTGPHADCRFEFTEGNREVKVDIKGIGYTGTKVTGSFKIKSYSKPRYPAGQTVLNDQSWKSKAPFPLWNEGITAGEATGEFRFSGERFIMTRGIGGSHRNVAPYSWDVLARQWWRFRAVVGPYTLVFWKFISAVDTQTYLWSYLEEGGNPIYESAKECSSDDDTQCTLFTPTHDGKVHGGYEDKSTGFKIEYRSRNEKWAFDIEYIDIIKEERANGNKEHTQFVSRASGGRIGMKKLHGVSESEQNRI